MRVRALVRVLVHSELCVPVPFELPIGRNCWAILQIPRYPRAFNLTDDRYIRAVFPAVRVGMGQVNSAISERLGAMGFAVRYLVILCRGGVSSAGP